MNKILDYEQVIEQLQKITNQYEIIEHSPIGYSSFGLPIPHYSIGSGQNHIVVTGATHGTEIITTDFVLKLMIACTKLDDINLTTIHFIPMLNPEGYLISTSAVRQLIPRNMLDLDAQVIIKNYVKAYNSGGYNYQNIFANVDYSCISEKYTALRNNIKHLYEMYNIPKGTLQVWSANGNGVDLNQNCPYNQKIERINNGELLFGRSQYGNVIVSTPAPIGYPTKNKEFEYEPETKCFREFIFNLKHSENLCVYLNYHSAEDTIFYKPLSNVKITSPEVLPNIPALTKYNEALAKLYASNTTQNLFDADSQICCFNDMLRTEIPGDILVELSPIEGNPLSAYDDSVYEKTINDNLKAAISVIKRIPELYKEYKGDIYEQN